MNAGGAPSHLNGDQRALHPLSHSHTVSRSCNARCKAAHTTTHIHTLAAEASEAVMSSVSWSRTLGRSPLQEPGVNPCVCRWEGLPDGEWHQRSAPPHLDRDNDPVNTCWWAGRSYLHHRHVQTHQPWQLREITNYRELQYLLSDVDNIRHYHMKSPAYNLGSIYFDSQDMSA